MFKFIKDRQGSGDDVFSLTISDYTKEYCHRYF